MGYCEYWKKLPLLPNPLISSVNTPGSLSIKHQSPALDIFAEHVRFKHKLKGTPIADAISSVRTNTGSGSITGSDPILTIILIFYFIF